MKNPENLEKIVEEVEQGKHGRPESLKKNWVKSYITKFKKQ